jgi:mRNA interferase RelE/StbE
VNYTVRLADEARKHFARLDTAHQRLIAARIDALAKDPHDKRLSKPLHGNLKGLRSSRVGGRRIVYAIWEQAMIVYILSVDPRGGVYRDL